MQPQPSPPQNHLAPVFAARALRGFADGCIAVLLPVYLLALGMGAVQVGAIATATLLGSALLTLALGAWGHRFQGKTLMLAAAALMVATGLGFFGWTGFWPLLVIAFVGTINPSAGDVSVFLPLEHATLASVAETSQRTRLFARYALIGTVSAALGALASALPDKAASLLGMQRQTALRGMFLLYAMLGIGVFLLYRRLSAARASAHVQPAALGASKAVVLRLALLFSVDAFAGGLLVNALLAWWLFQKFGLSLAQTGTYFFAASLAGAVSQLAAPVLARRIGLINTMVFTHIPASLFLMAAAFSNSAGLALGLLLARALVSSMDVPARSAFVMSAVLPHERAAAASFTAVPRSLASALSPLLAGWLFQSGAIAAPLLLCGALKIAYDLSLWRAFRHFEINAQSSP